MRAGRYPHIISAVFNAPWMIDPDSLAWAAILDIVELRASGEHLPDEEIEARIEAAANGPRSGGGRNGTVGIVPLYGMITPRANLMSRMSGGTTAEDFRNSFAAAMADPDVDGIVIDIDSPGGNVQGIEEAAQLVRASRGQGKPIVAIANHMMASAAYYIGSQADEVVATPSGGVGSIGVVYAHQDRSGAEAQLGMKTTLISAGKYKTEGNPYSPLSDEDRVAIQGEVDKFYGMFVRAVAKGRGVSADEVRSGYGQGRTLLAADALEANLVDRIGTLEDTIRRVARGAVTSRAPGAAALAEPTGGTDGELEETASSTAEAESTPVQASRIVPARRRVRLARMAAREHGHYLGVGR